MNERPAGPGPAAVETHKKCRMAVRSSRPGMGSKAGTGRPGGSTGATACDGFTAGLPPTVTVAAPASDAYNGAGGVSLSRFALPRIARVIATRVVRTSHEAADFLFRPGAARATALGRSARDPAPACLLSGGLQESLAQNGDRRPKRADLARHRTSPR